jgi:hypothetical protein
MSSVPYGPPSPDTTAPDVSTVTPSVDTSTLPNQPAPPAPQQAPADQPQRGSLWKSILMGALNGLASGAGANTRGQSGASAFASGLAGGAAKQLEQPAQQQQANLAAAQQALYHANLVKVMAETHQMQEDQQNKYLDQVETDDRDLLKKGVIVPISAPGDHGEALQTLGHVVQNDPAGMYRLSPVRDENGQPAYQVVKVPDSPIRSDVTIKDADGNDQIVAAGTATARQIEQYSMAARAKQFDLKKAKDAAQSKQDLQDSKDADQKALKQTPSGNAKPQNLDDSGNPVWVPGVSADEKKKAELSENVVFNANNIASILARRPDLVGKVAGRFTSLESMAGTDDQDITSLQQDMHNIAMANVGIHGMRANDAVHDVERQILNNFKNGPRAIGGALKASADSVQTFIDNARPSTYKTHSKNGGALRSMVRKEQK